MSEKRPKFALIILIVSPGSHSIVNVLSSHAYAVPTFGTEKKRKKIINILLQFFYNKGKVAIFIKVNYVCVFRTKKKLTRKISMFSLIVVMNRQTIT